MYRSVRLRSYFKNKHTNSSDVRSVYSQIRALCDRFESISGNLLIGEGTGGNFVTRLNLKILFNYLIKNL
jgi:hypothetical protein